MTSDLELLQTYARQRSEEAFAEIVRRHLGLVYSAALRQVRSPQLAEEVAQPVFTDLARNAVKLKPDTILTAWLYQVTRRTAIDVVRRESRRQLREQIAVEMNAMNATESSAGVPPAWPEIAPLLDEAVSALDETDRAAVLLRYFENKSLREVGATLGASDDAAQKRVSRAVERLREFFAKRGVTVGAGGLAVVISANAVQAAPVGLAATISAAAVLAGTAVSTSTIIAATKTIAMTTLQKTLVTATVAVLAGAGIYEARQASRLRDQVQTLQQQQAPLAEQLQQSHQKQDNASATLAALQQENERLRGAAAEVLRLRGEVARLRAIEQQLAQLKTAAEQINDPFTKSVLNFTARAAELNRQLDQKPQLRIPELSLLSEADWIEAGKIAKLDSDAEVRQSLMLLRTRAKHNSYPLWEDALKAYLKANNGQLPDDPIQLRPYFNPPLDDAILQRYKMLRTGNIADSQGERWLIEEKSPVDETYDTRMRIGLDTLEIAPVGAGQ